MLGPIVTSPPEGVREEAREALEGREVCDAAGPAARRVAELQGPDRAPLVKERAKGAMRNATAGLGEGEIGSKEHEAVHERAKHVMRGRKPREF